MVQLSTLANFFGTVFTKQNDKPSLFSGGQYAGMAVRQEPCFVIVGALADFPGIQPSHLIP